MEKWGHCLLVKRKAFTLIEVLTTLFIISLLLLLILPNLNRVREQADNKQAQAMVQMVQGQIELYRDEHGEKEVTLEKLLQNEKYLNQAQGHRVKQLNIKIINNQAKYEG